ncbi:MFS transporter [Aeromicrobium senzhongii]|uniref:MFS transporter n=1 Tax=Aeromicrobium senzhongii TaxID=2663859 RepID=A0ABX6SUQ4_9ACTN|nr:MFS transporter [Aeromicrobium senzhongii]MTB88165.1 MFS transporter [Aeromicrobium senzhongii]QNL94843.1 MFS transporter [Aeromicrobium senzhongii]
MTRSRTASVGAGLVGALVFVEFVSGFLQGYYTPLATDIARHLDINDADVNWFEAAQLLLSALCVPPLSKLGDLIGHQRVLAWSAGLTAVATWGIALSSSFETYLVFWALQGVFTVWLPLEVALIYRRSIGRPMRAAATRRATGVIVAALQAGAIAGALSAGATSAVFDALWMVLAVPAVLTVAVVVVIIGFVPGGHEVQPGSLDGPGLAWISASLLLVTGGLSLVRVWGAGSPWPWTAIVLGALALVPFCRHELRTPDPIIDLRVMRQPAMWPVQFTALLFGVSVLGAQIPLSTFAQTDPEVHGYGLGLDSTSVAPIIGGYVFSMLVGALLFARISQRSSPRACLIGAATLVGVGYAALLALHGSVLQMAACMIVAGLGSGALVAALPAAAAAAAPEGRTAVATGLTNTTKTIGGSFASCIFGVALAAGATHATAASLSGYYTVWIVCSATAFVAAIGLRFVPRLAFADPVAREEELER